jgi:hypothetical protein
MAERSCVTKAMLRPIGVCRVPHRLPDQEKPRCIPALFGLRLQDRAVAQHQIPGHGLPVLPVADNLPVLPDAAPR